MSANTDIEWTDTTWNPTTGCDRVSSGCDNCYALGMAKRLKAMGSAKYQTDGDPRTSGPGFGIAMHSDALLAPLEWHKPRKVFVNSMSDLFHKGVTGEFIARVFAVMAATPRHTYQILSKRHGPMRSLLSSQQFVDATWYARAELTGEDISKPAEWWPGWPLPNVWLGVSVEDQAAANLRIPALLETPAAVRFLSCEPLLGPINLGSAALVPYEREQRGFWQYEQGKVDVHGNGKTWVPAPPSQIDWLIAGGESGRGARPMHPAWVRSLRDQCARARIPFHFKQWGEWAPETVATSERGAATALYIEHDGTTRPAAQGARGNAVTVQRNGKRKTGRLLDGRTHDEFPAPGGAS